MGRHMLLCSELRLKWLNMLQILDFCAYLSFIWSNKVRGRVLAMLATYFIHREKCLYDKFLKIWILYFKKQSKEEQSVHWREWLWDEDLLSLLTFPLSYYVTWKYCWIYRTAVVFRLCIWWVCQTVCGYKISSLAQSCRLRNGYELLFNTK